MSRKFACTLSPHSFRPSTNHHQCTYLLKKKKKKNCTPPTLQWKRRYAVGADLGHRAVVRLADVHEAVLDVLLGEEVAVEGEAVLAGRRLELGHVVQGRGRRQGGHIGPEAAVDAHPVAGQSARRVLEEHGHAPSVVAGAAGAPVARVDRPGVHVEDEQVRPLDLRRSKTNNSFFL